MGSELFGYSGTKVLVIGGATGMGAATAGLVGDLGAEVIVMDVADVTVPAAQSINVDLRDRASVDAAADQVDGPLAAVFACAGVADGTPGIMLINFTAQRHLVERLLDAGKIAPGGAVSMISSVAGLGWERNLPTVLEFLAQAEWDEAASWIDAHEGTDSYAFSKQAINAFVAHAAFSFLRRGVRLNAILPGPTDTPLARANADTWLTFGADYREKVGIDTLRPDQMASTLAFLCSPAASALNGITIVADAGHVSSSVTGSYDDPTISFLLGQQ